MRFMRIVLVLVTLAAVGGLAFLYLADAPVLRGVASPADRGTGGGSAAAEPGQFTPLDPPRPAPELSFAARDGSPARLADFRGHWVLVNLWATWCAPCLREMPSLDRLQAMVGDRLAIVAVSQDRGGAPVVDPFLEQLRLTALRIYLDPKGAAGRELAVRGLPTTFLLDGDGRIRAQLEGAAEWDSPGMHAAIERYLGNAGAAGGIKSSAERS